MAHVVDGMVDWHDPFRPFADAWRNVHVDGLLRYFDNNFFYRIPVFSDEPEPSRLVLAPRVRRFKALAEPAEFKVVVPGPVTFAFMSKPPDGMKPEDLAEAIAGALAHEAKEAVAAGASYVQIDEPILADPDATRDQAVLAAELASRIGMEAGSRAGVAVYFDVPKREIFEALLEAKVDVLSLGIADAPGRALDLISTVGFGGHTPGLGLINSRQIYDDDYTYTRELAEKTIKSVEAEEAIITTTAWLDLIPYRYSLRKTSLLGWYTEMMSRDLGVEYVSPLRALGGRLGGG